MAIPLLPFLDLAPYEVPFVDPKTGMMTDAWRRYHINLERVIFGVWRHQTYDAADFTTRSALISWNVAGAQVSYIDIFQMGTYAVVFFGIFGSTVSADIDILRIRIPTLRVASDNALSTFQNTIVVKDSPNPTQLGVAYVVNVSATPSDPVYINIERIPGADFHVVSAAINVQGCVIFECQSVVVP